MGWLKPREVGGAPSEVVPGYALSPYIALAPGSTPGTLYIASLLTENGAVTNGVGSSMLRVSEDGTTASMRYSYSGLTGSITARHIHVDPYLTHPSAIVYDIDTPATPGDGLQPDGSYKWTILPVAGLTAADIVEIIREGKAYINLHTAAYPNGEIRGNYTFANGSRTFTPPPAPPPWSDDSNSDAGAVRFLTQATFGANTGDIAALKALGATGAVPGAGIPASRYNTWIDDQFTKLATDHLPEVLAREVSDVFGPFDVRISFDTWKTSITAPDQLRQRVAFALSEIHVVSGLGPLEDNSRAISDVYDTLLTNAFLNFRDVLVGTTLTSGIGRYLDMLRNDKPILPSAARPTKTMRAKFSSSFPSVSSARGPMARWFSIPRIRRWPLIRSGRSSAFAHIFTGWDYGYDGAFHTALTAAVDWTRPMREVPTRHYTGPKRILNNEVLPGLQSVEGQPLDPDSTHISANYNDPAYQDLPAVELNASHDQLFNHPNVGPFICRQLIQRMVTSNPSRDYLYRVVQKFNDNGSGVRGDMKTVIKAILLDYEARSTDLLAIPAFGKQREPLMRVAAAGRIFRPANVGGTYSQSGSPTITITTTTPDLLLAGNNVFLEFTDTTGDPLKPAPTTGTYSVASVIDTTHYTINAPGWITGFYNQNGGSSTMTITLNGHWLPAGGQAYFDFTSGSANGLANFDTSVRTVITSTAVDFPGGSGNNAGTTFTITAPDTTARSGNVMIARFQGTYSAPNPYGRITIDTYFGSSSVNFGGSADHNMVVGDSVFLNFITTRDTTSGNPSTTANDLVYPIDTVPDLNTFTVLSPATINSDNGVFVFPQKAQPLVRNGNVNARPGTFALDNTDLDIGQTPLNSPTVFNFFLPEYKYPGALASQGITTPEFQTTAETTAVRHANFIYDGVFNPTSTNGISSFRAGSNALVLTSPIGWEWPRTRCWVTVRSLCKYGRVTRTSAL